MLIRGAGTDCSRCSLCQKRNYKLHPSKQAELGLAMVGSLYQRGVCVVGDDAALS